MTQPIRLGAVLYDPKVSITWDAIRDFFETTESRIDVSLFDSYERLVLALVRGELDIAWSSPLGWLDMQRRSGRTCRAIAMRDTDRDRTTHVVVRASSGIQRLEDLSGRVVAMGASDSPQATLIPTDMLRRKGLAAGRDYELRCFDMPLGLHGDHVGAEREAFEALAGRHAAACCMLDLHWQAWTADGTLDASELAIIATSGPFDRCVFAVHCNFPEHREKLWLDALFSMTYKNPKHRPMMNMLGVHAWLPGRTTGFGLLSDAVSCGAYFG